MAEKIIVYATFESAVKANLAKTKLDAYGVPCFLSDENLAGALPLQYFQLGQVRLHVFEADIERVREVLAESPETPFENL